MAFLDFPSNCTAEFVYGNNKESKNSDSTVKRTKRIVEKIDQLMDLCDELEKNIEQSKRQ